METITGHPESVTTLVFTPDEQYILTGSFDGTIRRGKIGESKEETSFEVLFQSELQKVIALTVSPDGQWILSSVMETSQAVASVDLLPIRML